MASSDMWTELVEPVEVDRVCACSAGGLRAAAERLSGPWLPNTFINDIVARFEVGGTGLQPAAEFISYDAETPPAACPVRSA
jgi:hypothetical protein